MSAKKIPPDLEPELLARAGRGESAAEIAAWLGTQNVQISDRGVRRFLEQVRREREPIARSVAVQVVTKTVGTDLAELQNLADEARAVLDKAKERGNLFAAVAAIQAEHAVRSTRLRLAGAEPDPKAPGIIAGGGLRPTAVILLPPERRDPAPTPVPPATPEGSS
jgi:hypothetical protein